MITPSQPKRRLQILLTLAIVGSALKSIGDSLEKLLGR